MVCQDGRTGCPGQHRQAKSLGSVPLAWGAGQFGPLPEGNREALKGQVKIPSAFQSHCLGKDHLEAVQSPRGGLTEPEGGNGGGDNSTTTRVSTLS